MPKNKLLNLKQEVPHVSLLVFRAILTPITPAVPIPLIPTTLIRVASIALTLWEL